MVKFEASPFPLRSIYAAALLLICTVSVVALDFDVADGDGVRLILRRRGGAYRFRLQEPLPTEGASLSLRYRQPLSGWLMVVETADAQYRQTLPNRERAGRLWAADTLHWVELRMALPTGSNIVGFSLHAPTDEGGGAPNLRRADLLEQVVAAGLAEPLVGVRFERRGLIIGEEIDGDIVETPIFYRQSFDVGGLLRSNTGAYLLIGYEWHPTTNPTATVSMWVEGRTDEGTLHRRRYEVRLRPGRRRIYLYGEVIGMEIERIDIVLPRQGALLRAIEVARLSPSEPIPADMGVILRQRPEQLWRRPDWEIFSWNLYPTILILDSRDYATQSRFFKRLAFFSEKRGYRGSLLSDRRLSALHGWNAHNYRAEDLSAFFRAARETGMRLNDSEQTLQRLLIEAGILHIGDGGELLPGVGGILGISQESYPALRRLLITHEGMHGVFYAEQGYRTAVREEWQRLHPEERDFWRLLLSTFTYSPDDEYLMINEFQGYLLQQEHRLVPSYFREVLAQRVIDRNRQSAESVRQFLVEYPQTFVHSADRLAADLRSHSGLMPGDLICLLPIF